MLVDFALDVIPGFLAGIGSAYLLIKYEVSKKPVKTQISHNHGVHVHRFDTMESDGLGWKCGECGVPRGKK